MNNIFPYVMNREKTDENLISGVGCSPDTVLSEFTFVKKQFKKEDGRTYVHIIQAFSPDDDVTPEVAHEIGMRFAEYFGGFQALIATHRNTDHIHNHIILNSVNMETGKKFHQSAAELIKVKEFSNTLCREYGLSETEAKSSFKSMPKWKELLRRKAYYVANNTCCKEDFIYEMELHGYKVEWKDDHKYITFTTPDGIKVRDNKLFDERLLKDNLELYYAMGGCLGPMANEYAFYQTPEHEPHAKQTMSTGLVNLIGNFLSIAPQRADYTPRQLAEMDKWEKERLEQILGKRISPEAFVCYCTREEYEQQSGLSLKM